MAARGAKLVNWLQDVFPEVASRLGVAGLNPLLLTGLQALRDRTLHFAAANVVLGQRMREHLARREVDADKIHIIENWADGDNVVPKLPSQSELRSRLGLQDHFVVGYSGNLGRAHEIGTFLAAAEALRTSSDIVFLMIGGGALMEELQSRSHRTAVSRASASCRISRAKRLPTAWRHQTSTWPACCRSWKG